MKKIKSMVMMLITFIALPYYMICCKRLLKSQNEVLVANELRKYGDDFLGIRGIQVKVFNEDQYIDEENCIFVSNHQSHNDIFILLSALKKQFRFIAKKELFDSFIFKNFMKLSKSYPLDRKDDKASLLVLKQAVADINQDKASVVVFPEGTRSHSSELGEFKVGLFSMLRRAKAPIIPLYIENSFEVGAKEFRMYVGNPIDGNGMSGVELCSAVENEIIRLKDQIN